MAGSSPFSLNYIKKKRAIRNASKPTAVSVITSRPYINPQTASSLFSTLPAELRNLVFQFALTGYPDPDRPYSRHSFWYRPGYTHARKIAIELLLTCRRIYLETNLLPIIQNEHVIWGVERSRMPRQTSSYLLGNRMKLSQRNAIQYVHLFTQQFWLEDWKDRWLAYSQSWPDGCPPRLRITIRHTDWWYNLLGENSPLALDPKRKGRARPGEWVGEKEPFEPGSWGQRFSYMKGLKEFQLEVETILKKRSELDVTADKAQTWRFPLGDGQELALDESSTQKDCWIGSRHFKGYGLTNPRPALRSQQTAYPEPQELLAFDYLSYYVVILTWRAQQPSEEESSDGVSEGTVNQEASRADTNTRAAPPTSRSSYNRQNATPTSFG